MRSETEIRQARELFVAAGDDPPAINSAVRDTLAWVLGQIPVEELREHYLVTDADYRCFTCPAGRVRARVTGSITDQDCELADILTHLQATIMVFRTDLLATEPDQQAHIELTLLLIHAAERTLHRLAEPTPRPQRAPVAERPDRKEHD